MILLENIGKEFDSSVALHGISLVIQPGEKVSLFGPNGAGKTTLLRILACLTKPSAGSFSIMGFSPQQRIDLLKQIGLAPQSGQFYESLTVRQNLEFYGKMYGLRDQQIESRLKELLGRFNLGMKEQQKVAQLSKGMKQRLLLVKALLHDPPILLLDEPYSGLDMESSRYLLEFLDGLHHKTVIAATHDFEHGVRPGQRLMIINNGSIAFDGVWQKSNDEFRAFYREVVKG